MEIDDTVAESSEENTGSTNPVGCPLSKDSWW